MAKKKKVRVIHKNVKRGFTELERRAIERGKYSTPKRRRERAKASDFLLPKERKFPYKIRGAISCPLLRAAIRRAAQHGYPQVEAKARRLYNRYCK
ncbi:hypothetical protein J7K91_01845 [bacterium]|nr:hypothetical protein [bacterium]